MKRTKVGVFAALLAAAALMFAGAYEKLGAQAPAQQSAAQQPPQKTAAPPAMAQSNGPLEYKETDIAKLHWPKPPSPALQRWLSAITRSQIKRGSRF